MTNRELALAIWVVIVIILILLWSLKNENLKKSVLGLFKVLFSLFDYFIMQFLVLYTFIILALYIYIIHNWGFDFSLIFTFLIFTITVYIPIISSVILNDDVAFEYRNYIRQVFSFAGLGVALLTSYTFNFIIEFFLVVPLLLLLGMIKGLSGYSQNSEVIETFADKLISFIGVIILVNWGIQFLKNISDLITVDFWVSLTIDFWGIFAYIPAILILPHFLSVDKKVKWYESYSYFDYIKFPFYYLYLKLKYKRRKKITTFDIYKIKLMSKPYDVFSVYAEIDKDIDIERLNYDIQTYCLKLRSGNLDEYDKMENTGSVLNKNVNLYADIIFFYFSIKDEKRYYPWYRTYLWRNPRLSQRYMPVNSDWIKLSNNLLVKPME